MNCVSHSLMFHHFHNLHHHPTQGSISSSDFIKMIDWLSNQYSILNASDFKKKFENFTLKETEICFSFDDALKCQIDVALPILEDLKIKEYNIGDLEINAFGNTDYNSYSIDFKLLNQDKTSIESEGTLIAINEKPNLDLDVKFNDFDISFI